MNATQTLTREAAPFLPYRPPTRALRARLALALGEPEALTATPSQPLLERHSVVTGEPESLMRAVERAGGRVTVSSPVGAGYQVTFVLPAA